MNKEKPDVIILDIDGCMTPGNFLYSKEGKVFKEFGSDDANILKKFTELVPEVKIVFATCDKRGYEISKLRCNDMGFECHLISGTRFDWMKENYDLTKVVFMGDEITDIKTIRNVMYSICPANSFDCVKIRSSYVTKRNGGHGAVAEALIHVYETFFKNSSKNTFEIFSE